MPFWPEEAVFPPRGGGSEPRRTLWPAFPALLHHSTLNATLAMEYYQSCQNRSLQTIAVINTHVPSLTVGGVNSSALQSLCSNLDGLAQTRDNKVADADTAANAESLAHQTLRRLTLALPAAAEADLNEENEIEAKLIGLLDPVYAITPRTTELALQRARKLVPVLTKINAHRALTALPPVTSGGKGLTELNAAITAMPALEQNVETEAAEARDARTDLRSAARAVDRLNKRFYLRLKAEARENPDLAAALIQIDTEGDNLPETLSIRTLLQGGANLLHILIGYEPGTGGDATESHLDWMVEGENASFTNSIPVLAAGNEIGPFTAGQTVRVRTRTINSNGTRTSAARRLTLQSV
jgi:hypothetical protein